MTSLGAVSDLLIINMKLWPEEALDGGCFPDQTFICTQAGKRGQKSWPYVLQGLNTSLDSFLTLSQGEM